MTLEPDQRLAPPAGETDALLGEHELTLQELEKIYVPFPRDVTIKTELKHLVRISERCAANLENAAAAGRLTEGRALLLTGPSGTGKTRCLKNHFESVGLQLDHSEPTAPQTLISITCPTPFTLRQLGNDILAELNFVTSRILRENEVWALVRTHLKKRGVRFLHLDEFQHLTSPDASKQVIRICNTLKGLLQNPEWPICLILSGMPEAKIILQQDPQIRRRTNFKEFKSLRYDRDWETTAKLVATYAAEAGLDPADLFIHGIIPACAEKHQYPFISRLMKAACHQQGLVIEYIIDAIQAAFVAGESKLNHLHFAEVFTQRHGICEETNDELNVFLTKRDWTTLDVV